MQGLLRRGDGGKLPPISARGRKNFLHLGGLLFKLVSKLPVLYQVLNKQVPVPVPVQVVQVPVQVPVPHLQVPVPNLQVPVPVQVLCINYWHSVTLQLQKVKVVVSFILKNEQLEPVNFKHKVW